VCTFVFPVVERVDGCCSLMVTGLNRFASLFIFKTILCSWDTIRSRTYVYACIYYYVLLLLRLRYLCVELVTCPCITMAYKCGLCAFETDKISAYGHHYALHRNVPNFRFPCAHDNCTRSFRSYAGFKTHLFRDHVVRHKAGQLLVSESVALTCSSFVCNVPLCNRASANLRGLIQHVKEHIEQGVCTVCPFAGCSLLFKKKSTFSSHLSRKHHNYDTQSQPLAVSDINSNYQQVNLNTVSTHEVSDSDFSVIAEHDEMASGDMQIDALEFNINITPDFDNLFLDNIALLYMKLQGYYLLPSSTIQVIVEEFANVHFLNNEAMAVHLRKKMMELNLPPDSINIVLREMSASDIFASVHNARTGTLRSEHTRSLFFKQRFRFVPPVQVSLGRNKANISRCYHYVTIKQSLSALFSNPSVKDQFLNPVPSQENILADLKDGKAFKTNPFLQQMPMPYKLYFSRMLLSWLTHLDQPRKSINSWQFTTLLVTYMSNIAP
jgi:hypothetical protein